VIVHALDVALALRDARISVVSGFHSSVERECLKVLLRGSVNLVVCPATSAVGMRIPAVWKPAIAASRLTIRSAIDEGFEGAAIPKTAPRRATAALAEQRNRFVASISDAILILHAAAGGKLDRLADELLAQGKPLWTLDDPSNASLIARGARPVTPDVVASLWDSPR
jgi:hypothetical protein